MECEVHTFIRGFIESCGLRSVAKKAESSTQHKQPQRPPTNLDLVLLIWMCLSPGLSLSVLTVDSDRNSV